MAPSSFEIGKLHETRLRDLLDTWGISYVCKKKVTTDHGRVLELDFWLPPTETRGALVIECKNFGVAAQHIADSRRRKEQEALWLLIQIRRHCAETRDCKIVLVTGKESFTPEQIALLTAELGPNFEIATADQLDKDRSCLV
jgi:hypothetical protein